MSVRGVIGQINRELKRVERERARQQREADKIRVAAIKRAELAKKEEKRAAQQLSRAHHSDRKRLEKEAKAAHIEAMQAQAEVMNSELAAIYDEIDSILEATLNVDDYVDFDSLRVEPKHPPFDAQGLDQPIPSPKKISRPKEPKLDVPIKPSGIRSLFSGKKYAAAVASAQDDFKKATALWEKHLVRWEAENKALAEKHNQEEAKRLAQLDKARASYDAECATRVKEADEHNSSVDKLMAGLGYGTVEAVQEYISIVLSNSIYPDHFPVTSDFSFDPNTAELRLSISVPPPDSISTIKAYKYTRSSDEITSTNLSQKDCRDRYASAISQVALRSLHEIFEADRRGIIQTIDLRVGTETNEPSTGLNTFIPFIAVASERDRFMKFNLSAVVPAATLQYLGASVSKNPLDLVPADVSGIRRS